MPRNPYKPSKIAVIYQATPVAVPQPAADCGGLMCLDMNCKRCWGVLDDIDRLFDLSPGVAVDLDEATYAALGEVARSQGVTVSAVAQVVLQKWAAGKGRK